jgi:hypothetical protein
MDEVLVTGTPRGELGGLPPTGRTVEVAMIGRLLTENGTLREHRVYLDQMEFADQLGPTPAILGQLPRLAVRELRASF